jgi:hypothetical protein
VETGRKYTQNNNQRIEIQSLSDTICEKYGLHVLTEEQNGNYKKPGEYRAEQRGTSWKAKLKDTIDKALSTAVNRADFIRKMEKKGYQVKWTDTRENITFTTPSGMKCRDRRLGEPEYYNKRNFEMIFEQNTKITVSGEHRQPLSIQPILQDIAGMFNSGADWQSVYDGFMLQDIDFEGMTWQEIEDTIARLRREADTRRIRAMANQDEAERRTAQQTFAQTVALLDELEQRLTEQRAISSHDEHRESYDSEDDVLEL